MQNNNAKYLNNIKINYIYSFLKGIDLTRGIWMLFLVYKGMSLLEIGMIEGIYHISSFLMETPTGAIADIFGRKTSRLIGLGFTMISAILMIASTNFIGCAIAFFFTALSNNFESGAAEALIYDSLKVVDKEDEFMKVTGRIEVVTQLSSVVGLLIGGVIGTYSYSTIYLAVMAITVITLLIGLNFHEPTIHTQKREHIGFVKAIKSQYVDSYIILKGNARLVYIIIFGSIVATFLTLSFFYLQVAWKGSGFVEWQIGIFLAISSISAAFGGLIADKVDKKLGDRFILKYFPYAVAILIPTFYFVTISIISFSILCILESIIFVATRDYINKLIPSEKRATIISFDSAIFSLCMILIFPLFGFISDRIGIYNTFLMLSFVFLILTLINSKIVGSMGSHMFNPELDTEKML